MLLGKDFVMQGGVRNYLGETEEVNNAPRYWKSSPTSPKTELSYITDAEKKLLLDANLHGSLIGGKPNIGAAGLLSFDGWGDASDGFGGGGTSSGGGGDNRESYGGGGQYSGGGYDGSQTSDDGFKDTVSVVDTGDLGTEQANIDANINAINYAPDDVREQYLTNQYPTLTQSEIEKGITDKGEIINEKVQKESLVEKAFDLYQQYGLIPNALRLGGSILNKLGDVSKSLQNKAIAFDLQNKLEKAYQDPTFDPFTPDASVTQLEQDLARAKAGDFTQSEYQDRYAPQMNQMSTSTGGDGGDRAVQTALTPYAPYVITDTTPQQSVVQDYFSGLNLGQSISSGLQTDYNNAKNNINSILGVTPLSQQFGYSTQPYGLLSSTNMAANPFNIDYLRTRGLI
jgi:hypothetical protein